MISCTEPSQSKSGTLPRVSSFRITSAQKVVDEGTESLFSGNCSEPGLTSSRVSMNERFDGFSQATNTDSANISLKNGEDLHAGVTSENRQVSPAANKDFHDTLKQFRDSLSYQQRTAFRVITFQDIRNSLWRIQKEQARRFSSMDLPRVNVFMDGIRVIEKKIQFTESAEFIAYVLGTTRFCLQVSFLDHSDIPLASRLPRLVDLPLCCQKPSLKLTGQWKVTSSIPNAFDTIMKVYKTIGETITFGLAGLSWLSVNAQKDFVLARICADILQIQRLILRALSVPKSILHQTFASTWNALSRQWEQLSRDLHWYVDFIETHNTASFTVEYEQRRLVNLSSAQAEKLEVRRRWVEIVQWLAGTNSLQHHEEHRKTRQETPESGAWLLKHSTYVAWRSDDVPHKPVLWLSGILGAGKTILASTIIDDCQEDDSASTAFFYCQHDDQQRTTLLSILKAIIVQLLTTDHVLLPWCYEQYVGSNQLSLFDEKMCTDMLTSILLTNDKTFIVVDGLDECEQKERRLLIQFFNQAVSLCESCDPGKLRVTFVSRDEHDIRKALHESSEIRVTSTDNGGDIKRFVMLWCQWIGEKFEELETAKIDYILESTLYRADGELHKAKHWLDNDIRYRDVLVRKTSCHKSSRPNLAPSSSRANSPRSVSSRTRSSVSTGLFMYRPRLILCLREWYALTNFSYDRILRRISNDLDSNAITHAKKILGWMTCARRPLKWHEIQGALSVDTTDRTVDFVQRQSRTHIREICGSLISNLSGDRLELVHVTAKE